MLGFSICRWPTENMRKYAIPVWNTKQLEPTVLCWSARLSPELSFREQVGILLPIAGHTGWLDNGRLRRLFDSIQDSEFTAVYLILTSGV